MVRRAVGGSSALVLTWAVCSGRLAQKLRRIEELCALAGVEDDLTAAKTGDALEAEPVHAAPPLNPRLPVDAISSAALNQVRWRAAPVPQHTPAAGSGAADTATATAALSRVTWRTAPPVTRQVVCTAEDAAQMKALTVGVSYRQITVSPITQTVRPQAWVSKQVVEDEVVAGDEAAGASAEAIAKRDRRARNPEAPQLLHNKAARDIAPYSGSRENMTEEIDEADKLLKLEEAASRLNIDEAAASADVDVACGD